MPSYATTSIVVTGPNSLIQTLQESLKEHQFDFNKLIPCPQELNDISSPVLVFRDQETADSYQAEYLNPLAAHEGHHLVAISQDTNDRLIKQYGVNNWYDWCLKNWGTKWNGDDVTYDVYGYTMICISFKTPWNEPTGIFKWIEDHGGKIVGATTYDHDPDKLTIYGSRPEFDKYFIAEDDDTWFSGSRKWFSYRQDVTFDPPVDPELLF